MILSGTQRVGDWAIVTSCTERIPLPIGDQTYIIYTLCTSTYLEIGVLDGLDGGLLLPALGRSMCTPAANQKREKNASLIAYTIHVHIYVIKQCYQSTYLSVMEVANMFQRR